MNPANVDVELPLGSRNIQRGLLLVTKIIKNLANVKVVNVVTS